MDRCSVLCSCLRIPLLETLIVSIRVFLDGHAVLARPRNLLESEAVITVIWLLWEYKPYRRMRGSIMDYY